MGKSVHNEETRKLMEGILKLQEVDGIGKKRIQMIRDSWERQKEIKNVMLFLKIYVRSMNYCHWDSASRWPICFGIIKLIMR